jgi:hypothetical protein
MMQDSNLRRTFSSNKTIPTVEKSWKKMFKKKRQQAKNKHNSGMNIYTTHTIPSCKA